MVFRFLILLFLLLSTSCKDIKQEVENKYASTFQKMIWTAIFLKIREFMFDGDRYNDVEKLYEAGDFSGMLDIPHNAANKMMLKILYATDYSIAYSQLYKFSSETYNFEPQTEIRIHKDAECQKINTLVISY